MTQHPDSTDDVALPAIVLAAGPRAEVDSWVDSGVVPVTVVPYDRWTAVVGSGEARVGAPYDDAMLLLAGRSLSGRAGPGIGLFELDGRVVLTTHPGGRRKGPRWVVWEPSVGLLRPPGLELAGPGELARLTGGSPRLRHELVELLHERHVRPRRMLLALVDTLGLPVADLVSDPGSAPDLPGAVRHEPDADELARFEDAVRDSVRLRRELGEL